MPVKKTLAPATGATAYVLRITLRDLRPAIWREVWVAPTITLRKLHHVIQAAMGWDNEHLYGFALPGTGRASRYWGVPPERRWEPPEADDGMGFGDSANSDARAQLGKILAAPQDGLLYLYDFGDDWEHTITLQKIVTTPEPLPRLAAAALACPPENCGGVGGFAHLSDVLRDPRDPGHAELRAWVDDTLGTGWVPGELDAAAFERRAQAVARLRPRARRVSAKQP